MADLSSQEGRAQGDPPRLTLAICTYNRADELRKTLQGLERLTAPCAWEVIIVDNGSTDRTLRTARDFASTTTSLRVRIECEPRRGVSFARNRALEAARSGIVVFVDDDMDCDPCLLEAHARAFEDPSVVATGGRVIPCWPSSVDASMPPWLRDAFHNEIGGPTGRYDFGDAVREITRTSGIAFPFTGNMGLRREAALEVGGFRTDLGWSPEGRRIGGEDTDLMKRMSKAYGRILYLPGAVVRHRLSAAHLTEQYYREWHIAYGRASVLMRGRRGALGTLLKIIEQVFRIVRYSLPPIAFLYPKAVRLRKRYQAIGRILQLLGLQ
jgi:glycosyltransferase involved in cell wall biosynthesis